MEIKRVGTQLSGKEPADWFTGTVRVDPLFQASDPALVSGASVTFEPSARTAWHTHPLGQTLIVTAGCGWVQREGGPVEQIRPGCRLVLARRETLAWSHIHYGHDSRSRKRRTERLSTGWNKSAMTNTASGNKGRMMQVLSSSTREPMLRRTSALVTEWSQNCGHLDTLSS